MASAIIVTGIESFLTARGAGHSHSHNFWESDSEHDDNEGHEHHRQTEGLAERRNSARPRSVSIHDLEASQGLVAGVSPLPQSTPTTHNGKLADDFNDGDSDLDIDMDELDPGSNGSSSRNGQYSSLTPNGKRVSISLSQAPAVQETQRQLLQCLLLEAGILFHSVFIGMAISVATGPAFVVFLVAITFHQAFEGLALGSRIAAIHFPRDSVRPWLMVLAYGMTTPIGQAIGLIVHGMYDPQSMGGLLVVGFMNAISAGLLLYAGLVQLLAEDFLTEKSYKILKGKRRLHAYLSIIAGALLMALVGAFA